MNCTTPGLPVHHQPLDSTQTHVHYSVMPSNHPILCRPLHLLPSIFPSIRVFSNESALHISSVQFSCSVVSNSLWPHESQHTRPPCPSPPPGVHSDSRPLSQWSPAVGDGQGGLACCDSWCRKESDTTEQLNWTELMLLHKSIPDFSLFIFVSYRCTEFINSSILIF